MRGCTYEVDAGSEGHARVEALGCCSTSLGTDTVFVPAHDREDAAIVLSAEVGLERLCSADQRRMLAVGRAKGVEAAVEVDIVGHDETVRAEDGPHLLQLEQEVSLGMSAVVDEHIDW